MQLWKEYTVNHHCCHPLKVIWHFTEPAPFFLSGASAQGFHSLEQLPYLHLPWPELPKRQFSWKFPAKLLALNRNLTNMLVHLIQNPPTGSDYSTKLCGFCYLFLLWNYIIYILATKGSKQLQMPCTRILLRKKSTIFTMWLRAQKLLLHVFKFSSARHIILLSDQNLLQPREL